MISHDFCTKIGGKFKWRIWQENLIDFRANIQNLQPFENAKILEILKMI